MTTEQADYEAPPESRKSLRRWNLRPLLLVFVAAALMIGVSVVRPMLRRSPVESPLDAAAVGKSLQQLDLQALTGGAKPLELEDLRGRVVLLNFWGTWCPPCRLEMPHLVNLYRELHDPANVLFVSVSCYDDKNLAELANVTNDYLQRNGFGDLPTYADIRLATRLHIAQLAGLGQSFNYPTTLVIDQRGVIRGLWIGVSAHGADATVDEQRALIEQLLDAGAAPNS